MNDVTQATGFLAFFKKDIEPRMMELAVLRTGKITKIPVEDAPKIRKVFVKYEAGDQDWEYVSINEGGRTWIAPF